MNRSIPHITGSPEHQASDNEPLTTNKRTALAAWIATTIHPIKAINLYQTSTALKNVFARSAGGFVVTNSQFKGAMLAAGFHPVDNAQLNWTFHVRRVRV